MKPKLKKGWTIEVIAAVIICALPIGWIVWEGLNNKLGANPIEALIRQLGVWGLRLLIFGLVITPLSKLLKQPRLIRLRRPVGLMGFAFVSLHLLSYVAIDQFFDWSAIFKDILKRPFITIGMGAFVLLIPLAVTSFNSMMKRLGPSVWRNLHRLIYLIVPMGVVHYYLMLKADKRSALVYGAIAAVLLLYRLIPAQRRS
jgi:sulfoxide reductase heme-binding subunit YedZ